MNIVFTPTTWKQYTDKNVKDQTENIANNIYICYNASRQK